MREFPRFAGCRRCRSERISHISHIFHATEPHHHGDMDHAGSGRTCAATGRAVGNAENVENALRAAEMCGGKCGKSPGETREMVRHLGKCEATQND